MVNEIMVGVIGKAPMTTFVCTIFVSTFYNY